MYVVITGSSRGIGLELTRLALEQGHNVLAIARDPKNSVELQELAVKFITLKILKLDILAEDAVQRIKENLKAWPRLDILINNAGIFSANETVEEYELSFLTNAIKPFFISRGLFDEFKKSDRPLSLQISSQMGSLANNTSGGSYSYRASKAALNMLYRSLSLDEEWLISLLVHPGWVQTRMGGKAAPTSPTESAEGIWKIINRADSSYSGKFLDFRGETLPW